jgi:hypothetical protein
MYDNEAWVPDRLKSLLKTEYRNSKSSVSDPGYGESLEVLRRAIKIELAGCANQRHRCVGEKDSFLASDGFRPLARTRAA